MSLLSTMSSGNELVEPNSTIFNDFVEKLKQTALESGISENAIKKGLTGVHFITRVVKFDRNQPEKRLTFDDYLTRTLTPTIVSEGRKKLEQYHSQLSSVSEQYGVTAPYIVALWGVESFYGRVQGKEEIVSALATLAFEGRRKQFFTNELIAALRILDQQKMTPLELKGSWAGAMGHMQFMPSSFLGYGADGSGDGKIDIWNNVEDVFASAANYLVLNGWHSGKRWGEEVKLPPNFQCQQTGVKVDQAKTVAQWQTAGVKLTLPDINTQQRAWIITPDGKQKRAFMVFDNFLTLMHWNRSVYFGLSIGMLADAIANEHASV